MIQDTNIHIDCLGEFIDELFEFHEDPRQNIDFSIGYMQMKNMLITGGSGFVATSLLSHLNSFANLEEYSIFLSMRRSPSEDFIRKFSNLRIQILIADLTLPWTYEDKFHLLINLAAQGDNEPYSDHANRIFEMINRNLIAWAIEKKTLERIFHASSGAVHGRYHRTPEGSVIQDFNLTNWDKNKFSITRRNVENRLIEFQRESNIKLVIGRLFTFAGVDLLMRKNYAITSFIKEARHSKKIEIKDSIFTTRSYLAQTDLAEWILRSLQFQQSLEIINIGSAIPVTLYELALFIANETNAKVLFQNNSIGDYYVPEITGNYKELGLIESIDWKIEAKNMINLYSRVSAR